MSQTKKHSFIETCCNVGSGFIVAMLVWEFLIEPLYGIDKDFTENFGITCIYTVISIARGYLWRRIFNHNEKDVCLKNQNT